MKKRLLDAHMSNLRVTRTNEHNLSPAICEGASQNVSSSEPVFTCNTGNEINGQLTFNPENQRSYLLVPLDGKLLTLLQAPPIIQEKPHKMILPAPPKVNPFRKLPSIYVLSYFPFGF